jgi:hypothetical protein
MTHHLGSFAAIVFFGGALIGGPTIGLTVGLWPVVAVVVIVALMLLIWTVAYGGIVVTRDHCGPDGLDSTTWKIQTPRKDDE